MSRYLLNLIVALLLSSPVQADWSLENDSSQLSFVSTKAIDFAEAHRFTDLAGRISDKGKVAVSIALASVDTGIEIRDERMRELLFETERYNEALIRTKVDIDLIEAMPAGTSKRLGVEFELKLHGKQVAMDADIIVTRLSENTLTITSAKPVVLSADNVDLGDGIEELRKVANLPSIGKSVPVSFLLTFVIQR